MLWIVRLIVFSAVLLGAGWLGLHSLAPSPAWSQEGAAPAAKGPTPPEFVPFVVDKQNYDAVRRHLDGLTFKDAWPLVNWLETLEAQAKRQWASDNAPKSAPGDAPK